MSHGGPKADLELSHAKYDTLHWFQEIAYNLLHLKSTDSQALLMKKRTTSSTPTSTCAEPDSAF